MTAPLTPLEAHPEHPPAPDPVSDVIRWAAFSCVLVPVVLLWSGASLAGALGTAVGLAAVTAVCRVLLRRSEACAARPAPDEEYAPRQGRHQRHGTAARRGGRHSGGNTPAG
ncbi:hypothetical protein [Streptomyces cadmiisoli]|uniref:Uncharacterized protein n=1 Tax=Streptomyces cadmiisoli TaxID=2184053 RepID=A0A2Z4J2H3_9ACTN|nr:hypothetical protein [Streptomyces cadmiisoli]AWW39441.1 hypothetical protein DN051_24595 [Streptomyces cadmiisoli]